MRRLYINMLNDGMLTLISQYLNLEFQVFPLRSKFKMITCIIYLISADFMYHKSAAQVNVFALCLWKNWFFSSRPALHLPHTISWSVVNPHKQPHALLIFHIFNFLFSTFNLFIWSVFTYIVFKILIYVFRPKVGLYPFCFGKCVGRKDGRKLQYMSCWLYQSIRNLLFYWRFWKCPLYHGQKMWTFSSKNETMAGLCKKKTKQTRSYLDRSPSGMKRFMNHVDAVESGPYSTFTQGQTVIVCLCICVWRETLLYLGYPWLCVCLCVHVWPTLSHSRCAPFYSWITDFVATLQPKPEEQK